MDLKLQYIIPEYIYKNNILSIDIELYRKKLINDYLNKLIHDIKNYLQIKTKLPFRYETKPKIYFSQLLMNNLSLYTFEKYDKLLFNDPLIIPPKNYQHKNNLLQSFYRDLNNLFKLHINFKPFNYKNDTLHLISNLINMEKDINEYIKQYRIKNENKIDILTPRYNNHILDLHIYLDNNLIIKKKNNGNILFSYNNKNIDILDKRIYNKLKTEFKLPIKYLNTLICCCIIRYQTLNSGANQYVLNLKFKELIRNKENLNFECFASMFNHYYKYYCSMFYDIESNFGSLGSFFSLKCISGFYSAFPPYDETLLNLMYKHIHSFFPNNINNDNNIIFLMNFPKWNDYKLELDIDNHKIYYKKYIIYDKFMNPYTFKYIDIPPYIMYLIPNITNTTNNKFINKIKNIQYLIENFYNKKIITLKQFNNLHKSRLTNINKKILLHKTKTKKKHNI